MEKLPHIGRLCRTPYLGLMERVYKKLAEQGYDELNTTFSVVFQTIGEGARLTEMAKKANLTKQNMKHLVEKMKDLGYIQVVPDSSDGRANILSLTDKGIEWRDRAYGIIDEVEKEWAVAIGEDNMQVLKELLYRLGFAITAG